MYKKCLTCNKNFRTYPCRKDNHFCSKKCYAVFLKNKIPWNKNTKGIMKPNKTSFKEGQPKPKNAFVFPKGNKHPNWKGRAMHQGYVCILNPSHPRATKNGYVRRSIMVIEKIIGRHLKPEEVVHHIDKIKTNDKPHNLQLFRNNAEHMKLSHFNS